MSTVNSKEDITIMKQGQKATGMSEQIDDGSLDLALGAEAIGLKQKIGLTFKCSDLQNMDAKSKSDAFCVLWNLRPDGQKQKLG